MTITLLLFSVLLSLILPFVVAGYVRRRYSVPWLYFCAGILTFLGAQLVHFPLNELLVRAGLVPGNTGATGNLIRSALLLGLTAGLTEETARVLGFKIAAGARNFQGALFAGLGHGGLEAMLIGGVLTAAGAGALWHSQSIELWPSSLSHESILALEQQWERLLASPGLALAPLVERLTALAVHLALSVIVMLAVQRRKALYWVVAVLYHTAIDATAVIAGQRLDNPWLIAGLLILWAIPGLILLLRVGRDLQIKPVNTELPVSSWRTLVTSARKELLFQWRSRRFIIVLVVFMLFGMLSPLLARFTPAILGSIEGAERFADLIPEPTIRDSFDQYVKNITQFGFILAIILGMSAVVGEKERGTAAVILSKPIPKWAFLYSKFVSQAIVYAVAFSVAYIAAFYYTLFLFEGPPAVEFAILNLLLLLWMLVFTGVALVSSTIARSTGAAAGIAAIISITLLLAGGIPRYGDLAPSGLVAWGSALVNGLTTLPNLGAVAMAIVLILLSAIFSLALFEQQDV